MACFTSNQYGKAIKILTLLYSDCRLTDDFRAVLMFRALCYEEMKLKQNAVNDYNQLLLHDEYNSTAWSNLGLIQRKEGKHDDALYSFFRAIGSNEKNAAAHNNLASLYLYDSEYEKAIEEAEIAMSLNSVYAEAPSVLAIAYYALGDEEKSKKYFEVAVHCGADASGLKTQIYNIMVSKELY